MNLRKRLLLGSALVGSLFLYNCNDLPPILPGKAEYHNEKDYAGNIVGTVLWNPNKDENYVGVSGIDVMLFEGSKVREDATTGSGGSFSFHDIPEGHYKIEAKIKPENLDFFCTGSTIASVTKQETTTATIRMKCY